MSSLPLPTTSSALLAAYAHMIEQADIYDVAVRTSLSEAPHLSQTLGRRVLLKREDQQPVFSFKLRGAAKKISSLTDQEKACGVITASSGNHAQGVALAAKKFGVAAKIVMPRTTPNIKIDAVRAQGANVVLHGDAFPHALEYALALRRQENRIFVHPYDDPHVIAGQGTIGKEILQQFPGEIDAIFVPVGGGGLIAGIMAWVRTYRPEIKIIGVEPNDSDCLHQALQAQQAVKLPTVGLFADGVAVAQIGAHPFGVLAPYLDQTIRVSTDDICAAAGDIFADTRVFPEPAGALGVAGLKHYAEASALGENKGELIAIVSGANVDPLRMSYMLERVAIGQKREILIDVVIDEHAGALLEFCRCLNGHSITEFNYRFSGNENAHIFVGLRLQNDHDNAASVLASLRQKGFSIADMTENEMARDHIRHMVGGRSPRPIDETVYSLDFPERPGALLDFLEQMPCSWNISLFHYRCHGASHGRVLMGVQVPTDARHELTNFMARTGFNAKDESGNLAYQAFLAYSPQPA